MAAYTLALTLVSTFEERTVTKALAGALGLVYGELAVSAGYISRQEYESPIDDRQLARLTEIGDLSDEEWESVRDFARYVRSKRAPVGPEGFPPS